MNDNKNKTFTDLFFSSDNDKKVSDEIENSALDEKNDATTQHENITFGNLLYNNESSKLSNDVVDENESFNLELDKSNDIDSGSVVEVKNDNFDIDIFEKAQNSMNDNSEEIKNFSDFSDDNLTNTNTDEVVSEKNIDSENINDTSEKEEIAKDDIVNDKNDEDIKLDQNIFNGNIFDSDDVNVNDISEKEEIAEEDVVNDNNDEDIKLDQNIFTGNIFDSDDVNVNDISEKEEIAEDDFNNKKVDNEVMSVNNNIFKNEEQKMDDLDGKKIDDDKNGFNNQEVEDVSEKLALDNIGVDEKTSENPFFENNDDDNNSSSDNNPLLLNTLNLVENDDSKKKISSLNSDNIRHFNVKIVKKKEPLIKVIIGVISYAIFIWLLLIGAVLLIYVLDTKIKASKGDYSIPTYNAYVVLTGSMLPKIQVYDVVVTKKVDAADLQVGDIITFASADSRFLNTTITHRIIKKNYNAESKSYSFQTKGDNNNVADNALVPQNNIYGKVFLKIPKLGYLQEFLATEGGWIIVILIPCLVVISYDIMKLIKGLKRKKYKNIKIQK